MERNKVYAAIDSEREYQDRLARNELKNQSPMEFLFIIETIAQRMCDGSSDNAGEPSMDSFRKIAATAVRCMEQHGVKPRIETYLGNIRVGELFRFWCEAESHGAGLQVVQVVAQPSPEVIGVRFAGTVRTVFLSTEHFRERAIPFGPQAKPEVHHPLHQQSGLFTGPLNEGDLLYLWQPGSVVKKTLIQIQKTRLIIGSEQGRTVYVRFVETGDTASFSETCIRENVTRAR